MLYNARMLYIVATPIGNLSDITLRALEVLKQVDLVACEDTRETGRLLKFYGVEKPLVSFYKDNEHRKLERLILHLREGRSLALVCDRGTPGISDPAFLLVREARRQGIPVTTVPGASSLTAALSICGLPSDRFSFWGFLPRKKGRKRTVLDGLRDRDETLVFFESVHRVKETLRIMREIFGPRPAAVCRELTKKFEEVKYAPLDEIVRWAEETKLKGEFVIILQGRGDHGTQVSAEEEDV